MAVTTTPASLDLTKWRREFWNEFNRENLFAPYMGRGSEGMRSIIHQVYELKDEGENVRIPLIVGLSGNGVTGSNTLAGNEEAMDTYGHLVTIDWKRHGVLLNKKEMRKSAADQMAQVRPRLMEWAQNEVRDDIIKALFSYNGVLVSDASEAQRDAWLVANADRVLFGAAKANNSGPGDHSAALGNCDTTNDTMRASIASLAKRIAKSANPKIRPVKVDGSREYFVMFHGTRAFRDLKADSTITQANREARQRDPGSNPLFQDGDLIYDGIIHTEVPEIDDVCVLTGVGASTADCVPSFLCGAQAVSYGIGQMPTPTERKEDDYGFIKGRGVDMCYGINKTIFNGARTGSVNKDWGVVTVWTAAAADA